MHLEIDSNTLSNVYFNNKANRNTFACSNFEEIHFDIFEIKSNGIDFIKERVSEDCGSPVVLFNVTKGGVLYENVPFTLITGNKTIINENLLHNGGVIPQSVPAPIVELIEDKYEPIITESINVAKCNQIKEEAQNAVTLLHQEQTKYKHFLQNEINVLLETAANRLLQLSEQHKTNLIASISEENDKIKNQGFGVIVAELELIEQNICQKIAVESAKHLASNNKELLHANQQIYRDTQTEIANVLAECGAKLNENVATGIKYFHANIHETIEKLHNTANSTCDLANKLLLDKINECNVVLDIKFNTLKESVIHNITDTLTTKLDSAFNDTVLNIQDTFNNKVISIDLLVDCATNKIQQVQEAYNNTVETLQASLDDNVINAVNTLFEKQSDPIIESKIAVLKDELVKLINETTSNTSLFSEAKKEASEKVISLFSEAKSDNKLNGILKDNKEELIRELKSIADSYSKNLEKRFRIYADTLGGGGTVAMQFANGGTMNGTLNVTQRILSSGIDIATLFGSGGGGSSDTAATTLVRSSSSAWNSVYTTVNTNSASWALDAADDVAVSTLVRSNSSVWYNTSSILSSTSANWNTAYNTSNNVYTLVNSNSANWDGSYTTLTTTSAKWESNWTATNTNSAKWDNVWTTVNATSTLWATDAADDVNVSTLVRAQSTAWSSTFTTVTSNSAEWENAYTWTNSNSAQLTPSYLDGRYVNVSGDTMTGQLTITTSVSVGANAYIGNYAAFNTNLPANPAYIEGALFYDTIEKSLAYYNDLSGVTINIGQEQVIRVSNPSASIIPKGSVVYISGSQGNRPKVFLTNATYLSSNSHNIIGIATEDIQSSGSAIGYVTAFGIIRDITVTPGVYTAGDVLYMSLVDGQFTNVSPPKPNHHIEVGVVIRSTGANLDVFVRIRNSYTVSELHDTLFSNISGNDTLIYNPLSGGFWYNKSANSWDAAYTWTNSNSAQLTPGYLDARYVNVSGDTIVGSLSVTQTINIGDVQFTGLTSIPTISISATNVFLQVNIGSSIKYIRLHDII